MTTAFSPSFEGDPRWIKRYLGLQNQADAQITSLLEQALKDADSALSKLSYDDAVGKAMRRNQLLKVRTALLLTIAALYKKVGAVTKARQADAAALAADLLWRDDVQIWEMIEPDPVKRNVIRRNLADTASRNVQSMMIRVLETERPLSQNIYTSEAFSKRQLSNLINRHLAIGSDVRTVAKDVRAFVSPRAPGGVSYRARLLARTEINNAFHAQSINDAQARPWVKQVNWNLSKSHGEEGCACERYAAVGVYPADQVPDKPHPQCLCSITPVIPDLDTALNEFLSGQYAPWLPSDAMV